jgi:hypothetical protein
LLPNAVAAVAAASEASAAAGDERRAEGEDMTRAIVRGAAA